jgi:hypothetical protein
MSEEAIPVIHPRFGRGSIIQTRHRGLEIRVQFEDGLPPRWIRRESVSVARPGARTAVSNPQPSTAQQNAPTSSTTRDIVISRQQLDSTPLAERSIIEALRMGIVPHRHVDRFTLGRESEVEELRNWSRSENGTMVLVGEYGSGKTHLIDYTYSLALNSNALVAKAELDSQGSPFHKPKALYSQLIRSMRYIDSTGRYGGFRSLMNTIAAETSTLDKHDYLGPIIRQCRRPTEEPSTDLMWQWIEGQEVPYKRLMLPWLPPQATAASIYTNILTSIAWVAKRELGKSGLVLLFDEAELLDMLASASQLEKGENFVRGLVLASQSCPKLLEESVERRTVRNFQNEYRGSLTNLQYHGRYQVPFLFESQSYMKIAMAFTPIDALDNYFLRHVNQIWLNPLSARSRKEAFQLVCDLYREAYDFRLSVGEREEGLYLVESRSGENTRNFIKTAVEYLDYLRFTKLV